MDLIFDSSMFIFMLAIIYSQHYTITVFNKRINTLAREVGIRYATEKSKTENLQHQLHNVKKNKRSVKAPSSIAYMKGELQIHRDGVTSSCEATFKPRVVN